MHPPPAFFRFLPRGAASALALVLSLATPAQAQPTTPLPPLPPLPGEVIVGFRADAPSIRNHPIVERLEAAATQRALAARAEALGRRIGRPLLTGAPAGRDVQVMRAEGIDAAELARQLAADPEVAYAVPNGRKRRLAAPNDPLYGEASTATRPLGPASGQWYLRAPTASLASAIDVEAAWSRTRGAASVVVAVLDTGVRFEHPDLGRMAEGGRLLPGYDFVCDAARANDGQSARAGGRCGGILTTLDWDDDPSDPGDWTTAAENSNRDGPFYQCDPEGRGLAVASRSTWHGTSTASLVGAATDNGIGMAGTAPGVGVLPVRVLGKCFGSDGDIIAGMRWAAGLAVDGVPRNPHPARVLNLSLGGTGSCNAAYGAAVNEIVAAGVTIVAAAGNSVGGAVGSPANCPGVIGVVALRHAGSKVGFSDMGPEISIAAPGGNCVNLTGPCLYPILAANDRGSQGPTESGWTDSYGASVGTSFAAPLVSGVAGLLISLRPELTPAEVRAALQAGARPFPTSGADNGADDPTPVPSCTRIDLAGATGQCYCTTGLCGAGMLDAGASLAAVSGPLARISGVPEAGATVGQTLTLNSGTSLSLAGRSIVSWTWTLVSSDAGVVSGFTSATNAATATLVPAAAGRFTVRLRVVDSAGASHATERSITVGSTAPPSGGGSGGGGGSSSPAWVLALAVAAGLLRRFGGR